MHHASEKTLTDFSSTRHTQVALGQKQLWGPELSSSEVTDEQQNSWEWLNTAAQHRTAPRSAADKIQNLPFEHCFLFKELNSRKSCSSAKLSCKQVDYYRANNITSQVSYPELTTFTVWRIHTSIYKYLLLAAMKITVQMWARLQKQGRTIAISLQADLLNTKQLLP